MRPRSAARRVKNLPARSFTRSWSAPAAAGFVLASQAVDDARALKDATNESCMRAASRTNDTAMARFRELVHEGVTEAEVAGQLEALYRRLGAQGHSFTPIVSFGANAGRPGTTSRDEHAAARRRRGAVRRRLAAQDDYCADMTRTFFFRSASEKQREVYEAVRRAKRGRPRARGARRALLRPGRRRPHGHSGSRIRALLHAPAGPPDRARRARAGDVSAVHDAPVQPGMTFSIEPRHLPAGEFGVRIEDLVLVTDEGCEVLNAYPRDLTVLE